MSRYRKIETRTWADEKFMRLSPMQPSGQCLWFYLLTGPHTGPVPGLFRAGRAAMADDLDWPLEAFDAAFEELLREGMVRADFKAKLVWLPNAIKYNKPESPNVVKSWGAELDGLPECALKSEAIEALRQHLSSVTDAYLDAFNALFPNAKMAHGVHRTEPSREPSAKTPPKACKKSSAKPSPKPTPNQEQEQEQEQNITDPVGSGAAAPPELKKQVFDFGVDYLAKAAGKTEKAARAVIGKWVSQHGGGAALEALMRSSQEKPVEPIAFIEGFLRKPRNGTVVSTERSRESWERVASFSLWEDYVNGWKVRPETWDCCWGPRPDEEGFRGPPQLACCAPGGAT